MRGFAILAALLIFAAACGDDSSGEASDPSATTQAPTTTTAAVPPEVIQVDFGGTECSTSHASVPPGEHSFLLTDASDLKGVSLFMLQLEPGHSWEEVRAFDHLRSFGPDSGWPPEFVSLPMRSFGGPSLDLTDKQELHTWTLDAGEYVVMIDISQPWSHFSCAPLSVGPG